MQEKTSHCKPAEKRGTYQHRIIQQDLLHERANDRTITTENSYTPTVTAASQLWHTHTDTQTPFQRSEGSGEKRALERAGDEDEMSQNECQSNETHSAFKANIPLTFFL